MKAGALEAVMATFTNSESSSTKSWKIFILAILANAVGGDLEVVDMATVDSEVLVFTV